MRASIGMRVGSAAPGRGILTLLTPSNLLIGCVLGLAWMGLITWTGSGPDGWQARLCADLDARPRACGTVQAVSGDMRRASTGAAS